MRLFSLLLFIVLSEAASLSGVAEASGFIQSMQLHEKAMRARGAGDLPAAIEAAEAELAVVNQHMAGDAMHLGRVLPFLGELYLEADRFTDAEAVFAQALEIRLSESGATSGDAAGLRSRMGECRMGVGDHEAAVDFFEKAVAVFESKGDAYDLPRARTLELMAKSLDELERLDEAKKARGVALRVYLRTWDSEDPRVAEAKERLAD